MNYSVFVSGLAAVRPQCLTDARVAAGGRVLGEIEVDRGCFGCMLGGDDGQTLFIVANRYGQAGASDGIVVTQRVDVPHAGRP